MLKKERRLYLMRGLLRLVWGEAKAILGVKFLVGTLVAICAFWSIAASQLNYSPSEWFFAILSTYTETLRWLLWPVGQAIAAMGLDIVLSDIWLHVVALGMFYVSADALLIERSNRGTGYAVALYAGSLLLLVVVGVLIDVVLATSQGGLLKELVLFWLWIGVIALLEMYDLCLTVVVRPVREEWAEVYGVSPDKPSRLVGTALARLLRHQVFWPLVVLSGFILVFYSKGPPSEGFFAVGAYLLYMMGYWPVWDIICFRGRRHDQGFVEYMEKAYHWRFGFALFLSALAVLAAGLFGAANP